MLRVRGMGASKPWGAIVSAIEIALSASAVFTVLCDVALLPVVGCVTCCVHDRGGTGGLMVTQSGRCRRLWQ